uniref:Ribonuclease A-domain domain-containing protein n=1 Tax=Ursus maritimus TaxID=29073 RepID=A0A452T3Y1_URSMA
MKGYVPTEDMMLDLLGPFPLLLLLLGSWAPVHPLGDCAQPSATLRTFIIKHLRAGPVQCNREMPRVNILNRRCKGQNTFLHDSLNNVAATCLLPSMNCTNSTRTNCHQSASPIGMTYCNLTGGRFPNCSYSTTPQHRFYVVACDPPTLSPATVLSRGTLPILWFLST